MQCSTHALSELNNIFVVRSFKGKVLEISIAALCCETNVSGPKGYSNVEDYWSGPLQGDQTATRLVTLQLTFWDSVRLHERASKGVEGSKTDRGIFGKTSGLRNR